MKRLLYIVALLFSIVLIDVACSEQPNEQSELYAPLDSMIERAGEFESTKLARIAELRLRSRTSVSPTDRYLSASLLFDEYSVYNSDSAMIYVDRMLNVSRRCGNKDWEIHSLICKSNLLTATGLLSEALDIMNAIDTHGQSKDIMVEYYGQMIYLFSHFGNYAGGGFNEYYVRERTYKDSMMQIITPEHPDFLWYKGWDIIGSENEDSLIIPALERRLAVSKLNIRQDAKEAYILARLYKHEGNMELYRKYMILSAMVDVKIANAEIASLEELARMLFDAGDIDRAYSYVNYCLNKSIAYPNRVRSVGIVELLDAVNKAYQERTEQQQQIAGITLIAVCILAVVLFSAIIIIIVQNRRLRGQGERLDKANKALNANVRELSDSQEQLHLANAQLTQLNADLLQKNEELNEANYVKEEYIGYVFTICSNYIRKLEELRSSIYVKAVTKQYKEILDETSSDSDIARDELRDFYRSFDTIFLHIYPDFVNDFNSLLQEDKRIIPKDGELLNTELRIYALVRLGITDSIKIAEFLHCSAQTVYNYRFKVRNRAQVPKKDFAEAVRTLGKYME